MWQYGVEEWVNPYKKMSLERDKYNEKVSRGGGKENKNVVHHFNGGGCQGLLKGYGVYMDFSIVDADTNYWGNTSKEEEGN